MITKQEQDALEIAVFASVSDLLARYFELNRRIQALEFATGFTNKAHIQVDLIGSDECQIVL